MAARGCTVCSMSLRGRWRLDVWPRSRYKRHMISHFCRSGWGWTLFVRRWFIGFFLAPMLTVFYGAMAEEPLYLDPHQPLEVRVNDLLSRLTLEEKIALVHADSPFSTAAIPRLGIPERYLSDGPLGVREAMGPNLETVRLAHDFSTTMPAGICLAATWNPTLARAEGEAIGQEARARGKDIMLGPAVNIFRTPLGGRNFE